MIVIRENQYLTSKTNPYGNFASFEGWVSHAVDFFGDMYIKSREVNRRYIAEGKILAESGEVIAINDDYQCTTILIFASMEDHNAWENEANVNEMFSKLSERNITSKKIINEA